MTGQVIAKQEGVIAGLEVAQAAYGLFDPQVSFQAQAADGARVGNRQVVALVNGPARSLLTVERTALNFMGRMSGIATLTRRYVDAVAGTRAVILDTRNRVVKIEHVYKGSVNSSQVRVGELFKEAIRRNAVSLIVAHNHPSGAPRSM